MGKIRKRNKDRKHIFFTLRASEQYPKTCNTVLGHYQGVKYDRINIALINAVKQQQEQIERQQTENNELKKQVKWQEERLRRLEAAMEAISEAKKNQYWSVVVDNPSGWGVVRASRPFVLLE